jgi:hypothetical protein
MPTAFLEHVTEGDPVFIDQSLKAVERPEVRVYQKLNDARKLSRAIPSV